MDACNNIKYSYLTYFHFVAQKEIIIKAFERPSDYFYLNMHTSRILNDFSSIYKNHNFSWSFAN